MIDQNKVINDNLKMLLRILSEDNRQDVKSLYDLLKRIEEKLPSNEKLEQLKRLETDIEIKYEEYYEIGNYFDPLYIEIKELLNKHKVDGMRAERRNK